MLQTQEKPITKKRKIDSFFTSLDAPTLVIFGGMHGNERTGVQAIKKVFATIREQNMPIKGNLIGIRGNLKALSLNERFIDEDLNRMWTPKKINQVLEGRLENAESKELLAIHAFAKELVENSRTDVIFVDLHTTSGESSPFIIIDDTLRNRKLAQAIPATIVLGVIEKLKGTLISHLADYGCKTMVFEAGQHNSATSRDRHIAAIWITLNELGIVSVPETLLAESDKNCRTASKGQPKVVETLLRYGIDDANAFEMVPGFTNFSAVQEGQKLAIYKGDVLKATLDSLLFMPLYQNKGEDGYFIVKKISRFWLVVSKFLREIGLAKIIHYFPGVKRVDSIRQVYSVNENVAFFKPLQIMHLLGFRKEKDIGHSILVSKRSFDIKGPWD